MSATTQRYNVGGIYLQRPFKIRRLGHFGFNVNKVEEAREFYGDLLGFTQSDKADFSRAPWFPKDQDLGPQGYFMRYGTDHHAMVLFSKKVMDLRADRKFAPGVTINQITWQCGSLKEIADAHGYFEEQQVRIQRVGRDMPGSNWHVYVYDPDGHTNEFYYGIEQVGWNQKSKPRAIELPALFFVRLVCIRFPSATSPKCKFSASSTTFREPEVLRNAARATPWPNFQSPKKNAA